jgi:hypothetical protein
VHATFLVHFILLGLIILITLGEEYKLWSSSLCNFLQPPIISLFWDPNDQSQWPRVLRHELSSLARTLGSWVRIRMRAWVSMYAFIVCVVLCVGSMALWQADHSSKESYRLCKKSLRTGRRGQGPTKGCRAIHEWMNEWKSNILLTILFSDTLNLCSSLRNINVNRLYSSPNTTFSSTIKSLYLLVITTLVLCYQPNKSKYPTLCGIIYVLSLYLNVVHKAVASHNLHIVTCQPQS